MAKQVVGYFGVVSCGTANVVGQGRFGGEGSQFPVFNTAQNTAKTWIGGFRLGTNIAIDADATIPMLGVLACQGSSTWTFGSPLNSWLTGGIGGVCRDGQIQ